MPRIAHITDLHLSLDEPAPHGVRVWDNLDRVLSAAVSDGAEFIVFGGDLALYEGNRAIYRALAKRLESLEIDFVLQAGNHDSPDLFPEAFGRRYRTRTQSMDMTVEWRGLAFFLLDSSSGELSDTQIQWINTAWRTRTAKAAVFIHHPVLTGMHRYMDANFALRNSDDIQSVLGAIPGPVPVFCGHYHMDHTLTKRTVTQWITPATYVQIDPVAADFQVQDNGPGYRLIDFSPSGEIRSTRAIFLGSP